MWVYQPGSWLFCFGLLGHIWIFYSPSAPASWCWLLVPSTVWYAMHFADWAASYNNEHFPFEQWEKCSLKKTRCLYACASVSRRAANVWRAWISPVFMLDYAGMTQMRRCIRLCDVNIRQQASEKFISIGRSQHQQKIFKKTFATVNNKSALFWGTGAIHSLFILLF